MAAVAPAIVKAFLLAGVKKERIWPTMAKGLPTFQDLQNKTNSIVKKMNIIQCCSLLANR